MEIPKHSIPKARPAAPAGLPYIPKAKIYKADMKYLPTYEQLQQQTNYNNWKAAEDHRMTYMFDTNNQNQVNSLADVVINTAANVTRLVGANPMTMTDVITGLALDSKELVTNGLIKPMLNLDGGALLHNTWVNIIETVDTVDNLYKGAVIEGRDGFRRAFYERENFHFDTGNRAKDMFLEIATPTNVAMALLSGGTSAAAKAAATKAGVAVNAKTGLAPKILKQFSRAHKGNLDDTLKMMQKTTTLRKADIEMLTKIAQHQKNMSIMASLNYVKEPIRFFNDIGPKLAYGSSITPLWRITKHGAKGLNGAMKYSIEQAHNIFEAPTLFNALANSGKYYGDVTALSVAMESKGLEHVLEGFDVTLGQLAGNDRKVFTDLIKKTIKKLSDDTKGIKKMAADLRDKGVLDGGAYLTLEDIQDLWFMGKHGSLVSALDTAAAKVSQNVFKNFDEYFAMISEVATLHKDSAGVHGLYELLSNLKQLKTSSAHNRVLHVWNEAFKKNIDTLTHAQHKMSDADKLISDTIADTEKMIRDTRAEGFRMRDAGKKNINRIEKKLQDVRAAIKEANEIINKRYRKVTPERATTTKVPKAYAKVLETKEGWVELSKIYSAQEAALVKEYDQAVHALKNIHPIYSADNISDLSKLSDDLLIRDAVGVDRAVGDGHVAELRGMVDRIRNYERFKETMNNVLSELKEDTLKQMDQVERVFGKVVNDLDGDSIVREHLIDTFAKNKTDATLADIIAYNMDELRVFKDRINDVDMSNTSTAYTELQDILADYGSTLERSINSVRQTSIYTDTGREVKKFYTKLNSSTNLAKVMERIEKKASKKTFGEAYVKKNMLSDKGEIKGSAVQALKTDADEIISIATAARDNLDYLGDGSLSDGLSYDFDIAIGNLERLSAKLVDPKLTQTELAAVVESLFEDATYFKGALERAEREMVDWSAKFQESMIGRHRANIMKNIGDAPDSGHYRHLGTEGIKNNLAITKRTLRNLKDSNILLPMRGRPRPILSMPRHVKDIIKQLEIEKSTINKNLYNRKDVPSDVIFKYKSAKEAYPDVVNKLTAQIEYLESSLIKSEVLDTGFESMPKIDKFLDSISTDSAVVQKYANDAVKEYHMQASSLYRNLFILQDPRVEKFLDLAEDRSFNGSMEMLDAVGSFDTSSLQRLHGLIGAGRVDEATALYLKIADLGPLGKLQLSGNRLDEIHVAVSELLDIQKAAIEVRNTIDGMVSTRKLIADTQAAINVGDITEEIGAHFLDALQGMHDKHYDLVGLATTEARRTPWETLNMHKWLIKENIEQQLKGNSFENYKLQNNKEWILKTFPDDPYVKEFNELFPNTLSSHTAIADAYADFLTAKHRVSADLPHNTKVLHVDIESSSLSKHTGVTHQQSIVDPESGTFILYVNNNVPKAGNLANDGLYYTLFEGGVPGDSGKSLEELKELYRRIYNNADAVDAEEAFREHFKMRNPDIKIVMTGGEENLLRQFDSQVKALTPETGRMKLSMYNGKGFDTRFYNERLISHGITDGFINSNEIIDNLDILHNEGKVPRLTNQQKINIDNLIDRYIAIRDQEFATIAQRQQRITMQLDGDVELGGDIFQKEFLPAVDEHFRDNVRTLKDYFERGTMRTRERVVKNYDLLSYADDQMGPFKELNEFLSGIDDSLLSIRQVQDTLNQYVVDTKTMVKLVDPKIFSEIAPELRADGNVQVILKQLFKEHDMYLPIYNVKRINDPNLISNWFKTETTRVSGPLLERMVAFARKAERHAGGVANVYKFNLGLTDDVAVKQAYDLAEEIILKHIMGIRHQSYYSPILTTLKPLDNVYGQYGKVQELYNMARKLFRDTNRDTTPMIAELRGISVDLAEILKDPSRLRASSMAREIDSELFHTFKTMDDDLGKVVEFVKRKAELEIGDIAAYDELIENTVKFAKQKRMLSFYEPLLKSFDTIHDVAASASNRKHAYAEMRIPLEAIDGYVAYSKMNTFLQMEPTDMAGFLWHWGKGSATFTIEDLNSGAYFKARNKISAFDPIKADDMLLRWNTIMNNKQAYEDAGILISKQGNRIVMAIKEEAVEQVRNLPFKNMNTDMDFTVHGQDFVSYYLRNTPSKFLKESKTSDGVAKAMRETIEARRQIVKLSQSGGTSTLEKFDDGVFNMMWENLGGMPTGAVSKDTLMKYGVFDGNPFNHTVLGAVDSRRALMPFVSFNPSKTYLSSAQLLHQKVINPQIQYIEMLFDENWLLNKVLPEAVKSNQEVYDYLKANPEMKLAFLKKNKKHGYKLASVHVNGPADIAFARTLNTEGGVGAILIDRNTYTKAYEVINQNRLPQGFVSTVDKYLVATYKIGWMAYNYATVLRNVIDSGAKNVATARDIGIFKHTTEALTNYVKFKKIAYEMREYMLKHNVTPRAASEAYFSRPDTLMSKEMFQLITDFKNSGSSSGMVREMQKYYGDAVDKLHRKIGGKDAPVDKAELRELLRMNDDVAAAWLDRRFDGAPNLINQMMQVKSDFYYYKRAYEMRKYYKGADMSTDVLFNYQKTGRIPPEHEELYKGLLEKTKGLSLDENMFDKVMAHPLVDNALVLHAGIEEAIRIGLYTFLLEDGHSTSSALAEVIRTHFDYAHKTQSQMAIEMIAPFSTFRFNSIMYWTEELGRTPALMNAVGKYLGMSTNMEELEMEDIMRRRALQYQMYTGNLIINQDTGLTAKLNPSVINTLNFYGDPVGYAHGSIHSVIKGIDNVRKLEQYPNETDEAFAARKYRLYANLVPLVGSHLARLKSDHEKHWFVNTLISPMFNYTWRPDGDNVGPHGVQRSRLRFSTPRKQWPRRTSSRRSFVRKSWPTYTYASQYYGNDLTRGRNNNIQTTRQFRNIYGASQRAWGNLITRKGKTKAHYMMFPLNKWSRDLKFNMIRDKFRYTRMPRI